MPSEEKNDISKKFPAKRVALNIGHRPLFKQSGILGAELFSIENSERSMEFEEPSTGPSAAPLAASTVGVKDISATV